MSSDVVILDALRTPFGRRRGMLAGTHPAELLGRVQRGLVESTGIDPARVGQVIGGCAVQLGEQTFNVARNAWLGAGLPYTVAATTVDAQCGSSQQATALAVGLIAAGTVDIAIGCGVESMSRIPLGVNLSGELGHPAPPSYATHYEWSDQFQGSERIARRWGITRQDCDQLGLRSQQRAAAAWQEGRAAAGVLELELDDRDESADSVATTRRVRVDECLRESTLEGLAMLRPIAGETGVHTAGNVSQIADGAAGVLVAERRTAEVLGIPARARILDTCLVGTDPELVLTGPIDATRRLLARNDLTIDEIDVIEINEAFASVVLAWIRELQPTDLERINPNGGAIAHGHPLGATGAALISKALYELEQIQGSLALITMCCGGGLGTGMLLERIG